MTTMTLGARVKTARTARHWTREDLASATGLGTATLSRIELGYPFDPKLSTVRRLADELGVSVGWLVDGDSEKGTGRW